MGATALHVHVNALWGGGGVGVAYILRGDLTEGLLRFEFGGLIHVGDCFRNLTVVL